LDRGTTAASASHRQRLWTLQLELEQQAVPADGRDEPPSLIYRDSWLLDIAEIEDHAHVWPAVPTDQVEPFSADHADLRRATASKKPVSVIATNEGRSVDDITENADRFGNLGCEVERLVPNAHEIRLPRLLLPPEPIREREMAGRRLDDLEIVEIRHFGLTAEGRHACVARRASTFSRR
jgi:hypothetical protein